jgi:predicted AlkP superfamily phosphohydrolase/phosphomutase
MSAPRGPGESSNVSRVLVLGLDGGTFDLIQPMIDSGRLPTLGRLVAEGASGVLESTLPPVTIPAWVSMVTGKNPGKIGSFDLLRRDGYGVEPNCHSFGSSRPLWQTLNRYGIKTGMMNIPGTYPPEEVDGFMVTGMMTPSKRSHYSYPATLGADLDSTVSDYQIDVQQWQYFDEGAFVKDLYTVTEKRRKAAEYLIRQIPCEFYMIVFTSSDRLHHVLWEKREIVEAYWEELDSVIGRIIRLLGEDTTVIVVSDHGFGELRRTFFVNEWLGEKGFLSKKKKFNENGLVKVGKLVEKAYRVLGERKMVRPIANFLNKIVGDDMLQKFTYSYLHNSKLEGRVNWKKTKAFACVHTPHFGNIYINTMGKMSNGCVPNEERDEIASAIIRELEGMNDPETGNRMQVEAHRAEDIYRGPHTGEAPDIVFVLEGGRCEVDAKVGESRLFAQGSPLTHWTGTHTKEGVFIAHGPGIKPGYKVEKAAITDVTPTILHIFGIPVSDDLDGRVLDEIFEGTGSFPSRDETQDSKDGEDREKELNQEEKALIEARLRNLGYIS